MRELVLTPKFKPSYRKFVKRDRALQKRIDDSLQLMQEDVLSSSLGTHKLSGELFGLWACSCGYDCRIVFALERDPTSGADVILLLDIGTHDETVLVTSFPPIITPASTVLILGSMPGEMSLRLQQYYAHPRNHFWPIIEDLTGVPARAPYPERVGRLAESGVALWDSLKACVRPGSLDTNIVPDSEEPNDFLSLLVAYPAIRAICFNGKKSEQVFRRRILPAVSAAALDRLALIALPSTSPANASFTYEQKLDRWQIIRDYLPDAPRDGRE